MFPPKIIIVQSRSSIADYCEKSLLETRRDDVNNGR
jgi:hypothetical protein